MKRPFTLLLTAISAVLFVGSQHIGAAPQKKTSATKPKSANAPKAAAEKPFDLTLVKLPVPFSGNSVEWVLKRHGIAPKGEFETTAEYEDRVKAFQAQTYAFVRTEPEAFVYDADSETFTTRIYSGSTDVHSKIGWYFRAFDIHEKKLSESSYVGSNAFGAKALVTKTKWKRTQIVTDDTEDILALNRDPIDLSLNVPRDRARAVKPNLRVALICSPRLDQFSPDPDSGVTGATGYDIYEATIDNPSERWIYYTALRVDLLQIWVFDRATGEVYGRFSPQGLQLGPTAPRME